MNTSGEVLAGVTARLARISGLTWALLIGLAVRVYYYLAGPMLWGDEAKIALNFEVNSALEMLGPLNFSQTASVGWLLVVDVLSDLFGNYAYGGRLLSLIVGLASVFVFYLVAKSLFTRKVAAFAILFFALSYFPVRYSVELKPYIFDALICLMSVWFGMIFLKRGTIKLPVLAGFLIFVVLSVLFSQGAPILILALGFVALPYRVLIRDWRGAAMIALCCMVATAIFLYLTLTVYQAQIDSGGFRSGGMGKFFSRQYAPFPPLSAGELAWYPARVHELGEAFFGLYSSFTTLIFAGVGAIVLLRTRIWLAALLLAPFIVSLGLSALHLYPIISRLALFYVPVILLLAGFGLQALLSHVSDKAEAPVLAGLAFMFTAGSLGNLVSVQQLLNPSTAETDMSAELSYINQHRSPGDVVFVEEAAVEIYLLYRAHFGLSDAPWTIVGRQAGCLREAGQTLDEGQTAWLLRARQVEQMDDTPGRTYEMSHVDGRVTRLSTSTAERLLQRLVQVPDLSEIEARDLAQDCAFDYDIDVFLFGGSAPDWGAKP